MSTVLEILRLIYLDRWDIFVLVVTFVFRKDIIVALKGGNGALQMDEFAKAIILFVFYASFRYEATRTDLSHQVFAGEYWFALLGTVALIAGIKGYGGMFKDKNSKPENTSPET